jgi:hypothetical protein
MEHSVRTAAATALRDMLRGTWAHHIFDKLRSAKRDLMRRSEGEAILLEKYVRLHGKPLDLVNPLRFTEKLFRRMIALNRGENPEFTSLADKYLVRAYVANKVGEEYLIKLLWHGEDPSAIPFDSLPTEYVVKSNHACRQVIVVKGKADQSEIMNRLSVWLKSNHYWSNREHQYYHIKPRVILEEYLRNRDGSGLLDYRFWCFNGVPEVIQVDNHAHDINPFFDTKWNQLDLYYREGVSRPLVAKPVNLDQMMSIASRLSAPFDFVRVDLYNIDGKIYFGELTFTPVGGGLKLRPEGWDVKLGEKWKMTSQT